MHAAVQFQHIPAAGHLVQPVDVLRHNGKQTPRLFQLRQLFVGGVGLCRQADHLVPVEPVELCRMPVKIGAAENRFRRYVVLLVIQAVLTAEVRNPALGGNTCSAEKHNAVSCIDLLLQLLYFFHIHHTFAPFSCASITVTRKVLRRGPSNSQK